MPLRLVLTQFLFLQDPDSLTITKSTSSTQLMRLAIMILLLVTIIWIIYTLINRYKAGKQQQRATGSTDSTPRGERLRKPDDSGQEESIQPLTQQNTSSAPEKLVGQVNTVAVPKSVIKPTEEIDTIPAPSPEYNVDILTAQFIGYAPVSSFGQSGPLVYPLTVIPKAGCVVKFPKKGRFSNRGYKESAFELFLKTYFGKQFDVLTEHHLLVSNGSNPYEPDFSLIDRKNGLNM